MEDIDILSQETEMPQLKKTKNYKICLDIKKFSLTNLKIELYSDNSIQFFIRLIELNKSELYKNKFTSQNLFKIFNTKKNIFELCCELAENKEVKQNQKNNEKLNLVFTYIGKECIIELKKEKEKICEREIKEILFNELSKNNEGSSTSIEKKDSFTISNLNNNFNFNYNFNFDQINQICKQMKKCVCQINVFQNNSSEKENKGIGFFVRKKNNQNSFIPLLITNTKIINEHDITNEISITIILNNENKLEKNIRFNKNSKYHINTQFNIIIIEIPHYLIDLIDFFDIEEKKLDNIILTEEEDNVTDSELFNSINRNYNKKLIYSIYYPKKIDEVQLTYGLIEEINENDIVHKCFSDEIFCGSPIIFSKNNKLIGIHLDNKDSKSKLLHIPLEEFMRKYKNEFEEKNNENVIILDKKIDEEIYYTGNEITMEYDAKDNNLIKIFNEQFVENNYKKCKIIFEEKEYDLTSYLELTRKSDTLKLQLKEIETITDMSCMFHQCLLLETVNASLWDTVHVENMSRMFSECQKLKTLQGIENWKTNNVINMSSLFYGCSFLFPKFPDISSWNTQNVKDISKMFSGCKALPDISKWNLNSLEDMNNLFSKNSRITEIRFISNWKNLKSVTNMSFLFSECEKLRIIPDLSNWDVSSVKDMRFLFNECKDLIEITGIDKWDVSNVKTMNNFFSGCEKLKNLPNISSWNLSSVIDISYFFNQCKSLKTLPEISKWKISYVENINNIFNNCTNLTSIPDISKWNISKVKDISNVFKYCKKLGSIPDITKWDTSNVENMSGLFYGCENIVSLPEISDWNTKNVTDMSDMFCNCRKLETLPDISKWSFTKVKSMGKICYNCCALKNLPKGFEKINLDDVENKEGAFDGCNPKLKIPKNFIKSNDCSIY